MMNQWRNKCSATAKLGGRRATAAAIILLTLLIGGCESLPGGNVASEARAMRLLDNGDYDSAASMYMSLAGAQQGTLRDRYVLSAARAWVQAGDEQRAGMAIVQVAEPADTGLRNSWLIARAELANLRGDGDLALRMLSAADTGRLSLKQRIDLEGARGVAFFLSDDPARAIDTLQRRELWLANSAEIQTNHEMIWDGLLQADPASLRAAATTTNDPVVAGWLALGSLADGSLPGGPASGLAGWQRQYPGHPALQFIVPGLSGGTLQADASPPQFIALLVTASGRTGAIGEAVRDGFLTRYAEQYEGRINAPTVRVYDVSQDGAILAYQRAVADGAQFIVGPVLRGSVEAIANFETLSVPTLALNYTTPTQFQPALYQFGLAPEDEAAAAARRAISEGHRRAIALVPASDWGERVLQAFSTEFIAYGGEVLNYQTFIPSETDYKNEIQTAMLLNDSVSRYRMMRSFVGQNLQFEPRRRQDVDFIFMAATADSAKRLKPQLRFHYAGDLPVFATSAVNTVSRRDAENDLNGIRFNDIPWLVAGMRGESTPLSNVSRLLSSAQSQPRLYALGYDAFDAVLKISTANPSDPEAISWPGATGLLTLGNDNAIRRATDWAVFERGQPTALPSLPDLFDPLDTMTIDEPEMLREIDQASTD